MQLFLKLSGEIATAEGLLHACLVRRDLMGVIRFAAWTLLFKRAVSLDLFQNGEVELNEFEKYWNPKLYIENTMGEFKESVWYVVSYNAAGTDILRGGFGIL